MKNRRPASSISDLFSRKQPARTGRRRRDAANTRDVERLEDRRVMAYDLVSAYATTSDSPFFIAGQPAQTLTEAPQQVTLRFSPGVVLDPNSVASSISIVRSGGAGDGFGAAGSKPDVTVVPGSILVNDIPNRNEVVIRFAETLPDDSYQITVSGGSTGLKTVGGDTLAAASRSINVRLDLGAYVVSVVPQPVVRFGGSLVPNADQIAVYFNANDPLNVASAQTAASYRLFEIDRATGSEVAPTSPLNPTSVSYDVASGRALLNFATGAIAADKLYRLQVGAAEAQVAAPATKVEGTDFTNQNSSFANAVSLGVLTGGGATVNAAIDPSSTVPTPLNGVNGAADLLYPTQPGSIDEPGHRNLPPEYQNNYGLSQQGLSAAGQIPVYYYNFQDLYGSDPQGNPLHNAITETQKLRAREVFDLISRYEGVRFIESANNGITVATGDVRAISSTTPPDAVGGMGGAGIAIMSSLINWGASEYGGAWFQTAIHEIGHALGLQHSWDVPSIMGAGLTGESVFPGDYDKVQLSQYYPATGSDVDVYRFTLPTAGRLSAETIVARPGQPVTSQLDSQLTLYREDVVNGQTVRTVVARNDDYYGRDSFIGLDLSAGSYYIAVSSTGNDRFNPEVNDSGYGGRTDGGYQLKLGFQPASTSATTIVDASGTLLDGDRDGRPGGAYNFWFNTAGAAKTVFVDKAASGAGADGTAAKPYATIASALAAVTAANAAAAGSKTLVRIVGNPANTPYLVGTDLAGRPLPDGATFNVPAGVTVMIDEGAVFKLRATNIDVGSSSALVSRAGASLQVLGTPTNKVTFTSYHDDSIGGNSDGVGPTATGGQWGGIVFRADADSATKKAFVDSVSQAAINYGGGQVFVDSQLDSFAPIQLENTRPTLAYNTITNSAGAGISATPDSFEDANGRVGPEIRGNTLLANSINGLFVKIRTPLGGEPERLDVSARFRSTDIVYVLQDNLFIAGGTGGYILDPVSSQVFTRNSGRLTIDPGVIVKLQSARIELERGESQLIAEGTPGQRVVFTSLGDNRFGAGGTFDTNGNLPDVRTAGDWGGIVLDAGSRASIDYAYLAYGGGQTPIEGTFDRFNVIETSQGELRLAHSRLENNASGLATTSRTGRGGNVAATVFVRGAQPVLLGNDFRDNLGAVVSVNANSLTDAERSDPGRTTGAILRDARYDDNRGPLVRDNRLSYTIDAASGRPAGGAVEGMQVRGEEITVESVWDDADIVHVLQSEIIVQNFATATGIRLVSQSDASLVVKLAGANAGFTAAGYGTDISDRIGGTVQVVGQPGYPVILTSLKDDTVGASLDPLGQLTKDTNADATASTPSAGDWRSLKFLPFSNDTNVSIVQESEKAAAGYAESNSTPSTAQLLGVLAPDQKSGDDTRRLGFEVHGTIAWNAPGDADVYNFAGYSGSAVWIDLDKTSPGLDSMVELLDAAGNVLARSADGQTDLALSPATRGIGQDLGKDSWQGGDFYSVNPKDAGMRVILPGTPGAQNQYYVRVRSQPRYDASTSAATYQGDLADPAKVAAGATSGAYELRIRLQQRDEKPGSTVRYADIRFPQVGVDVQGLPQGSPLLGETGESTATHNSFATAQYVGNVLQSDKATISIAGAISSATDVDWYTFALNYEQLESIGGVNAALKSWSTMFDIDYGDGFRGDLTLSVFDASGKLIYVGRDSNVADDQGGATFTDLSKGSAGVLDPLVGSVQLPAGSPTGSGGLETGTSAVAADPTKQLRYYVAVSSNEQLPAALDATFKTGATNSLVRLEPIDSVKRIVEDHIGYNGYTSGAAPISPVTPSIINLASLSTHVTPFTLSDVTLFVSTATSLATIDAMRGGVETTIQPYYGTGQNIGDLAMRSDGKFYAYAGIAGDTTTAGRLDLVDSGTGTRTTVGNDAIPNQVAGNPDSVTTDTVDALAWNRTGNNGTSVSYDLYFSVQTGAGSRLYKADPTSAVATTPNPNPKGYGIKGLIQDAGNSLGNVTGMAFVNGSLYGVDTNGHLFRINVGNGTATLIDLDATTPGVNPLTVGGTPVRFAGLTLGPQNLSGGALQNDLFAIDSSGTLYAFDTSGTPQQIFDSNADGIADAVSVATPGLGGVTGLAFSPLDVNLWHPTTTRGTDAGHGVNVAPDNTRKATASQAVTDGLGGTRSASESLGGVSMAFNLEQYVASGVTPYLNYQAPRGQYGVLANAWQQDLATNSAISGSYNLPGGAYGSLTTNQFNLSNYTYADKPTLYFNYWLKTQAASSKTDQMRDSARVFVSTDGGATWEVIATNNSVKSAADTDDAELPAFASVSSKISDSTLIDNQHVQELFDSGSWRQARVDLGKYAGNADIRLRFDFSTAGEFDPIARDGAGNLLNDIVGHAGQTGNFNSAERGQNNQYEGFYVDDIIVGLAERGEMVTGATAGQTSYFAVGTPLGGSATVPTQSLTGPYQLEIRHGTTYAYQADSNKSDVAIVQTFDSNDALVASNVALGAVTGDSNTLRQQGQFLIQDNLISAAATYGVSIDAAVRDSLSNTPVPGVPRNLPVLNNSRLVPGVVVANNVVASSGTAGIRFSGDSNTGTVPTAAVTYGRIVNNTFHGGTKPTATGVAVTDNAGPTLMNNVFANLATGVSVDATSRFDGAGNQRTVIATSAFYAVGTQVSAGVAQSLALTLSSDPFVNASAGNYYPVANSSIVDSALNALADRAELAVVTGPIGVPQSPILAPDRDLYGQLRSDDPSQASAPGLGSNVFKDRGAIDRVDFAKPYLVLAAPQDGGSADGDPLPDTVLLKGVDAVGVTQFALQLNDVGAGIDKSTVTKAAFTLSRDGAALVEGTDYVFRYLETTNRVVFEAAAVFPTGNYQIKVNQTVVGGASVNMIADLAGNPLLPNKADGTTSFGVTIAQAPGIPSGVTGTPGDSQVQLSWVAPVDIGTSAITNYVIQYSSDSGASWTTFNHAASAATNAAVTGLTNLTPYVFRVAAVNSVGTGAFSPPSAPVTPQPLPPNAPLNVVGTPGDGSVGLSWTAPFNGGSAITDYEVQVSANGGASWTTFAEGVSTTPAATVTGLVNGTGYVFRVAARNANGLGAYSVPSAVITPFTLASAPTFTTAVAGDASASLAWTTPAATGGAPITGYVVDYTSVLGTGSVTLGVVNSATITGLVNGTAYTFRVRAVTAFGNGTQSAATAALTPLALPGAPTGAFALASSQSAYLTWTAPQNTGGVPVTGYVIRYTGGGITQTVNVGSATPTRVTGLTNGTSYTFAVAAVTAAGTGPFSAASNAVTPGPQPLAPTRLAATAGNGSVSLRWTASRTRGVSDYLVQYSSDGGVTWQVFDTASSAARATVTGLTNGTTYTLRVAAIVNGVLGNFSVATPRVMPYDRTAKPAVPANLRGASGGSGLYSLQWDAVAGNAGGPVTGYVLQYRVNSAANSRWATTQVGASATPAATLRRLTARQGYVFRVAAKNMAGVGGFSGEIAVH